MSGPLTVCYLGNFTRPWCTEVHVATSLEQLGHRVVRLQESETDWTTIPATVDAEGAHLLLWTRTWPADMHVVRPVLAELRARGVHSVSYHLDRWFGLNREHQVDDQPFFHTDLVVSPDDSPRWAEHGVEHLWMPPGVFGDECGPVDPAPRQWPFDVVFVGSFPYPHPEWSQYRGDLIGRFAAEFGRRFMVLPRKGQPIRGRRLQQLYATVPVILGDSCLAGESHRYWSDRIPETLGRGGALIHPEIVGDVGPGGAWYRDMEDMFTYELGDYDSAVETARWLLDNPERRQLTADRGRTVVTGRDTYRHRMAELLDLIPGRLGPWREPPAIPPRPAELVRVQARCGPRWRALFDVRSDVETDQQVIDEVWRANDYRVPPSGLSGTVLDIGANVGAFTVLAAKAGAERVIAVEPEWRNRERLEAHVALNHVAGVVTVIPAAVTGDGESVVMVGTGGGARSAAVDAVAVNLTEHELRAGTPATTLGQLLSTYGPVRFLKMDIEGGEYDALASVTANDMHEHVEQMALEFHGPVMPHLAHLADEGQLESWKAIVAMLADCGRLEILGHPTVGGLIWWKRY